MSEWVGGGDGMQWAFDEERREARWVTGEIFNAGVEVEVYVVKLRSPLSHSLYTLRERETHTHPQ